MNFARKQRPHPATEQQQMREALAGVGKVVDRVLAPFDVSAYELPETLRAAFVSADNLVRSVSLDVRRAAASEKLGATRYLRWGGACQDWLDLRETLARGNFVMTDALDRCEATRTYALGCAEEILRLHRPEAASKMEGEPEKKPRADGQTSPLVWGALGVAGAFFAARWMGGSAAPMAADADTMVDLDDLA